MLGSKAFLPSNNLTSVYPQQLKEDLEEVFALSHVSSVIHSSQEVQATQPSRADEWMNNNSTMEYCAQLLICVSLFSTLWTVCPDSSVHGDSPGKNTGVGCHALLQGIFLSQGSNPGLPHCRWIIYQLSHQGSPNGMLCCLQKQGTFDTSYYMDET